MPPPRTMRAAAARGGCFEIGARPLAEPGPGEARVRIRACGICGSDLHLHGLGAFPPGRTPGHEIFGEVDALGDDVGELATGQPVALEPLHSCGRCPACRAGLDNLCRELEIFGVHRDGGFAEYLTLPARRLFPVPEGVAPAVAALCEPMAVCVHGLRRGELTPGQRLLVLGAGSVGLLAVVAARALGAGPVWLTARHPHQAALGRALGAERVLSERDATPEALDALGRESPVDLVVETVGGHADTLAAAGAAVRPGGSVSVLGVFLGALSIQPLPFFLKEVTLAWSSCYAHRPEDPDFATAVRLVHEQREALAQLTTHAFPLDEIGRAFARAEEKKTGAVKVTVLP